MLTINKTINKKNTLNIYLYDFDGTIVKGDTGVKFFWWWSKDHPLSIFWVPCFAVVLFLYKLKLVSHKQLKEYFFKFLPKDRKIADKSIKNFWDLSNKHQLNKKVIRMLKKDYTDKNGIVICISGSPDFFIKPAVKNLPVDVLICTNMKKNNYRKISGANCNGEEKVKRLSKWLKQNKINKYNFIKTVSDSQKDLPIYKLAKKWYAVDRYGNVKLGFPKKAGTFYWR